MHPSSPFRGIWYSNQAQNDCYAWKYSGGLATYPQQIIPLAVYDDSVRRTYFTYAGANELNQIENAVAYFDHDTRKPSEPVVVLHRKTNDAHYNGTIALAPDGHILLFCNSHGIGLEMNADDPTYGKSYIYRSRNPHDISTFECIREDNFSYSQVWTIEGKGMVWLHTRYQGDDRPLFSAYSKDGIHWSKPEERVRIARGSYQISWPHNGRIFTAFDYHPQENGLNARSNLYLMTSDDLGQSWQTLSGETLQFPLRQRENPALEIDFEREGLLVYLKDLAFDQSGVPHVLLLTSHDCWSGPKGDPRILWVVHYENGQWIRKSICEVDHNYDHGSLWIHDDENWEVIAPTGPGPQEGTTGGEIQRWQSTDRGETWRMLGSLTPDCDTQHTYVRKPYNAHPGFWSFWADADAIHPSSSQLYYSNRDGQVSSL